jgi:transposase, IS5 family
MRESRKKKLETDKTATTKGNRGALLSDATCCKADIRYPNDLTLLNEAGEKAEALIKELELRNPDNGKTLRIKPVLARKDYLAVSKKRKKSAKLIRKGIRKQLQYLKRDLQYITELTDSAKLQKLTGKQYRDLLVIHELYRQQKEMHEKRVHRTNDRIVSIAQPYIRPTVRGKAGSPVEFGSKITIGVVSGFTFSDRFSYDNYNEAGDLSCQVEKYKERFGYYPESVHVDQIYQTRANRTYCKERNIRISGVPLGRPAKDKSVTREKIQQYRQDARKRIAVEGRFGVAKRRYSMGRIMTKTAETEQTTVSLIILMLNLDKLTALSGRKCRRFFFVFRTYSLFSPTEWLFSEKYRQESEVRSAA